MSTLFFLNLILLANSYEPLVVSVPGLNHFICENCAYFQKKVGGEFMWNSQWISPAVCSYLKPCQIGQEWDPYSAKGLMGVAGMARGCSAHCKNIIIIII